MLSGVGAALVLAVLALWPAQTLASHVECGDVITQDTRLDGDLVDCPGDGVVVGASGITINLGGHTIDGAGVGAGAYGVDDEGHDGITVRNGRIQQFFGGVYLDDANDNVVRNLRIDGTGQAIYLEDADRNLITHNVATASGNGVYILYAGTDNAITQNLFSDGGGGVTLVGRVTAGITEITRTRIAKNSLIGNGVGYFGTLADNTVVDDNRITGSPEGGIIHAGAGGSISGNRVWANGFGISMAGLHNSASGNRVTGNAADGITVPGGSGASNTTLEDNVAKSNGDDGIDVNGSSATVARNTANDNGDLGIEAAPGVSDGGGNRARGNGDPAQCLNITCR